MNYFIKKDLTEIVRAKESNSTFFAMRQGLTVPKLKVQGYIVEHADTVTSGLITREFMSLDKFKKLYNPTDIATLDVTAIGTMITSFAAADTSRPKVVSTSPVAFAQGVAKDATVTVTFNEAIAVILGKKAAIYHDVDGEFVKVEDSTSLTVGGSGNKVLTIGHSAFTNGDTIKIVIPADTIEDASVNGNNYNTAYSFQFSVIPAQVVTSVPEDNDEDVAVDADIVVTYLNALDDATSTFALTKGETPVASTVTYDTAKKVVTVNPDADLDVNTEYTLTCHAVDTAGQVEDTVITFTTVAE